MKNKLWLILFLISTCVICAADLADAETTAIRSAIDQYNALMQQEIQKNPDYYKQHPEALDEIKKYIDFLNKQELEQEKYHALAQENIIISNYQESPLTIPYVSTPIALDVSFDVTQKLPDYDNISISVSNENPDGTKSVIDCKEWSDKKKAYGYDETPSGLPLFLLKGLLQTRVRFVCIPREIHQIEKTGRRVCYPGGGKAVGNPENEAQLKEFYASRKRANGITNVYVGLDGSYVENVQERGTTVAKLFSGKSAEITDLLLQKMPSDSKLKNYEFWHSIIEQIIPVTLQNDGYGSCPPGEKDTHGLECYCHP